MLRPRGLAVLVMHCPAPLALASFASGAPYTSRGTRARVAVAPVAELPVKSFASQEEWESWLDANHTSAKGVWVKIAKKATGIPTVTHAEALESALCHGWIDGQRRALDDRFFLQKFTPRGPRSSWSRVNRDKALALIAEGRMRPAGLAEVERAQADGRWDTAYEPQSTAAVPADLQRELDANPRARSFFATLDSRNRYAILYRLQDAKKPDTRERRLAQYVAMLAEHRKLYP
jgi:uncharacterized protein YdeI (YjbR/CyaY-like superfamily)